MGNIYSAQNVAAYFIYELNEQGTFINLNGLSYLLSEAEKTWQNTFGHSAYKEEFLSSSLVIKEIEDAYEDYKDQHITIPAKDWYLEYGQFQLVYRTYGVPKFTSEEKLLVQSILVNYQNMLLRKVS